MEEEECPSSPKSVARGWKGGAKASWSSSNTRDPRSRVTLQRELMSAGRPSFTSRALTLCTPATWRPTPENVHRKYGVDPVVLRVEMLRFYYIVTRGGDLTALWLIKLRCPFRWCLRRRRYFFFFFLCRREISLGFIHHGGKMDLRIFVIWFYFSSFFFFLLSDYVEKKILGIWSRERWIIMAKHSFYNLRFLITNCSIRKDTRKMMFLRKRKKVKIP